MKLGSEQDILIQRMIATSDKHQREMEKTFLDMVVTGQGLMKYGIRSRWNPLRYILGKHYRKHISLRKVFK